ncbi:MAG: HNH endonuclease [Bacteroidetes bacterium]|nr:HNH endonuclease [Bacteroidota bacterium]
MGFINFITDVFSDTYTDKKGYKRYKNSNKPVHRDVAEKKLGRKLREGEVVHHKDRDKQNNSKQNLWVFKNQEQHDRAHKMDAMRHGKQVSYKGFKKKSKGGFWDLFK